MTDFQEPRGAGTDASHTDDDQGDSRPRPHTVVNVNNTATNQPCTDQEKRNRRDWVPIIVSVLSLIVAGMSFGIALHTWRTNNKGVRAYIAAIPQDVWNIKIENPPEGRFTIKNIGKTVADNVEMRIAVSVGTELPRDIPDQLGLLPIQPGRPTLQPETGGTIVAVATKSLAPPQIKQITDTRETKVFVYGRVTYTDIFGEPRFTNFCRMYSGNTAQIGSAPGFTGSQGQYCERGNEAN